MNKFSFYNILKYLYTVGDSNHTCLILTCHELKEPRNTLYSISSFITLLAKMFCFLREVLQTNLDVKTLKIKARKKDKSIMQMDIVYLVTHIL